MKEKVEGTVSRDFPLKVFFTNHLFQAPDAQCRDFDFFQKFTKIFATHGAPLLSTIPFLTGKQSLRQGK
jgi:hypothetical protein